MTRNIFKVDAMIVDANGTYNVLEGFPKIFDSKNYNNDIDKTKRRAEGAMSETVGCDVQNRYPHDTNSNTVHN